MPATTLAKACYSQMFSQCRGLKTALNLPATSTVNAENCYDSMFYVCPYLRIYETAESGAEKIFTCDSTAACGGMFADTWNYVISGFTPTVGTTYYWKVS